jgi:hypothetical protein
VDSPWAGRLVAGSRSRGDAGDGTCFREGQIPDSGGDDLLDRCSDGERRGALFPGYLWGGRGPRKAARDGVAHGWRAHQMRERRPRS